MSVAAMTAADATAAAPGRPAGRGHGWPGSFVHPFAGIHRHDFRYGGSVATTSRSGVGRPAARTYAPGEIAWMAAIPSALALAGVVLLLGPPLGRLLFQPTDTTFWPLSLPAIRPEPTEHARYVLALLGPLLVSGIVLLAARRPLRSRLGGARALASAGELVTIGLLVACFLAQHLMRYGPPYYPEPTRRAYFTVPTLVTAVALGLTSILALRRDRVVERVAELLRERTWTRPTVTALAALVTAIWLLTAVNTDSTIGAANPAVAVNFQFWLDEPFAVLNDRPPLVDFHAQYAQLWPYVAAGAMALLGATFAVYVGVMVIGAATALLAIFALLRRLVGSSWAALGLYLPFLSTSFFMELGPLDNRYGPSNLFSLFPMRYGGPYVLAWLTVRHLDGARPHRRTPLFLAAGLVAINNVEFGLPAFGATLAALLWAGPSPSWRTVRQMLAEAALGLLGAVAAVTLLTLGVAGSLPHFAMAFTFSRLYGVDGYGLMPMRPIGIHLAIYATFAAAIVVATIRAARKDGDVLLTGALAWAGVFGLGAGTYFAGRSHPEVLIGVFSMWALALVLLVVVTIRAVRARAPRWPKPIEAALLVGAGIAVCSIAQTPAPWTQLERLGATTPAELYRPRAQEHAIAAATRPGEPVAILAMVGHRIAYDIGVVNTAPYADLNAMPAADQLHETIDALRAANGRKLFLPLEQDHAEVDAMLDREGFRRVDVVPEAGLVQLVDTR
jgi:hypothetical protein